jgi:multisubunit Na+/H+ antiporter MnhB subunit
MIRAGMKKALAKCREAGSFIAGVMIGVSIVATVIVMTVSDHSGWQTLEVFGALVVLALGSTLQVIVTAKPRRPHATEPEPGALPARFMELGHER